MSKQFNLLCGDSYEILKTLPDNSIDSIVTDPPYGLSKQPDLNEVLTHWLNDEKYETNAKGFMGKSWDSFVPSPILWKEAFRVLKPGGHILAFAGTRTQHLMAMSLGLAGFEIRDVIFWCYGSGFPKSQNIGKALEKQGIKKEGAEALGTALKPAVEPITLARKPITEKTIAKNVLKHGTGGLNIDDCRIPHIDEADKAESVNKNQHKKFGTKPITNNNTYGDYSMVEPKNYNGDSGRFPSNLIIEENELNLSILQDKARYFYHPKCSKTDRNEGLEDFEDKEWKNEGACVAERKNRPFLPSKNNHPTVKPTELMAYLCRLITPKGGTILDPFNGSGSTGKAAMREGFNYIGIDLDQDYIDISKARIEFELSKKEEE